MTKKKMVGSDPALGSEETAMLAERTTNLDLIEDPASTVAMLRWYQGALFQQARIGGRESIVERVAAKVGPIPSNVRLSRGFPPLRGLNTAAKMAPCDVWPPSFAAARGRLVDPEALSAIVPDAAGAKYISKATPGPRIADGYWDLFLSPRIGAGDPSDSHAAKVAHLVVLLHAITLVAAGEPEPDSQDRVSMYNSTSRTALAAVGYETKEGWRENKFKPTPGLALWLEDIAAQLDPLPVAAISVEPGRMPPRPNNAFRVTCPYNLDNAETVNAITDGVKIADAIRKGEIHFRATVAAAFNTAEALPWCGQHAKAVQVVMLARDGSTVIPIGIDPIGFQRTLDETPAGLAADVAEGAEEEASEAEAPPVAGRAGRKRTGRRSAA